MTALFYFHIVRLLLIVWSMVMISAVESVAIRTEGMVELESTSRDAYAKVLTASVASFLGDAAFSLRKRQSGKCPPRTPNRPETE